MHGPNFASTMRAASAFVGFPVERPERIRLPLGRSPFPGLSGTRRVRAPEGFTATPR